MSLRTLALALCLSALAGCNDRDMTAAPAAEADAPPTAAPVERHTRPRRIEIQRFTQLASQTGVGEADTLEVVVAARDSADAATQAVGVFQFELAVKRGKSLDRMPTRVAYWRVGVENEADLEIHWQSYSGFYRFPLQIAGGPLPPGRYVVKGQFTFPDGEHLFDELPVDYDGGPVPALAPSF